MRTKLLLLPLLLAPNFVAAQTGPYAERSIAAGYKAVFTCANVFAAGRTVEASDADDLVGAYGDLRSPLAKLPEAAVDRAAKRVAVTYDTGAPPRFAAWRPWLGCVSAPSGAAPETFSPPSVDLPIPDYRKEAWPKGDRISRPLFADTRKGAKLAAIVAKAFDGKTYGPGSKTSAVLIVKDGVIVAESYRKGLNLYTSQRTWSAAKSIWATVIGAAVNDGLVKTDEPAGLAQWSSPGDPRGRITFDNLLRMASGLDSSPAGSRTDEVYFGGARVIDAATTRRLVTTPGTLFAYANNDTMSSARALRERMKDDDAFRRYPIEKLFLPLGMTHTTLGTDWNGDFIASSAVWTTARDLARLGLLYLANGEWEGRRILPADWRAYVSRPSGPQPDGGAGYGAQFWLYGEKDGLPAGTFAAQGNRGQYLVIVPERNILIVRRAFDDIGGGGFDIVTFARDALKDLQ